MRIFKWIIPFDSFAYLANLEVLGNKSAISCRHYSCSLFLTMTNFYYKFPINYFAI